MTSTNFDRAQTIYPLIKFRFKNCSKIILPFSQLHAKNHGNLHKALQTIQNHHKALQTIQCLCDFDFRKLRIPLAEQDFLYCVTLNSEKRSTKSPTFSPLLLSLSSHLSIEFITKNADCIKAHNPTSPLRCKTKTPYINPTIP